MKDKKECSHSALPPYTLSDLLQGEHLDVIAAVLLLSGRLRVNSVELYRGEPAVLVTLIGEYKQKASSKAEALASFLEENDDMTVEDILEALRLRL
ncbi:hypothetical protein [Salibacterium sp. K-3]